MRRPRAAERRPSVRPSVRRPCLARLHSLRTHYGTSGSVLLLGIWNESVPIQLAQCWFHGLTISSAKCFAVFLLRLLNFCLLHLFTYFVLPYKMVK